MTGDFGRWRRAAALAMLAIGLWPAGMAAQNGNSGAKQPTTMTAATNDAEFVSTQEQLLKLLKMSPTLTEVVARDPSLLADSEYVNRNNPQLGQFLTSHPEVGRNPGFYLFTNLPPGRGDQIQALEHKVWPEQGSQWQEPSGMDQFFDKAGPFLIFLGVMGTLFWLIRTLMENRRWGRIFKLQTEVHGKLIDKFGNNQDLLAYMGTEAGRRFLEAAPIPVNFEDEHRVPNAVARVLTPLQIGVVMTLLGIGLVSLRWGLPEDAAPLLLLGVLALMPGLGFIISAGLTWVLAGQLGLMPADSGMRKAMEARADGFDGRDR